MSYTEDRLRALRGVSPARSQPLNAQYSQAYPVAAPSYQPAPASSYQPTSSYQPAPQQFAPAPSGGQYLLSDAHSKVHEKVDQRLRLETEKRELELLIEGEVQRQKQMNSRFEEQKKKLRDEIYTLESRYHELEGKYESKNKVCKEIDDKITETKAESRKLEQENKTIMSELKRLAEKTNQQIVEQQNKLKQNIAALETEKEKFRRDTEQKKMENANLIKKSEEDYIKKLSEISNRVATAQAERERYHKDVGFLKDKLASLEKEAELKLKEMETKIRDDEKNKRAAAMVALNQKLKSAEEKRANQEKITSQLERELKDLEVRASEILGPLDKEAKSLKDSIDDCKKGIEVSLEDVSALRKQISDAEKECAQLAEARQRLRQEMARAEEQHGSAVREQNERFNAAKRNYESEIAKLRRNIEDKERELKRHEDEFNGLNREHQRLMTNLQNNITKTFSNTVNDKPTKY